MDDGETVVDLRKELRRRDDDWRKGVDQKLDRLESKVNWLFGFLVALELFTQLATHLGWIK